MWSSHGYHNMTWLSFTRLHLCLDEVEERKLALAQVGGAGWPVVHLEIDVVMVVNTPRTIHVVVPYTLQVGRHIART